MATMKSQTFAFVIAVVFIAFVFTAYSPLHNSDGRRSPVTVTMNFSPRNSIHDSSSATATGTRRRFEGDKHEVPSGANPISNR